MTVALARRGRFHPALDVGDDHVWVGRVTDQGDYQLISSEPAAYDPGDPLIKPLLTAPPRPHRDLTGRWSDDDAEAFVRDPAAPTVSEVFARMMHTLDTVMEFPRAEHRALVAAWTLGTYFHRAFLTFPRLALSGERETGKSKLQTFFKATAWNAILMMNPTPAVLFRLAAEYRASLLLDEAEGLSKEDKRDVLAIINSGYKAGGTVQRCEGDKRRVVESFEVFTPLTVAGIKHLHAVTEDRCLPLVLQRGIDRARINTEVDPLDPALARIRHDCYRLLLVRFRDVRHAYQTQALPAWLNGRARELWKPLLAVAAVADAENGLQLATDLLTLAREHVGDRAGISAEGEALLVVLSERLISGADRLIVHPGDLREPLQLRLGWRDPPSAETVAALLCRLGFRKAKPQRDRDGVRYEVLRDRLTAAQRLYLPDQEGSA